MRDGRASRVAVAAALGGVLAAAALGGCTAAGGAPSRPTPPEASGAPRADDGAAPAEPARRGPLEELLDAVRQVGTETPEAQLARLVRSEEIVTACMREQGFDYAPFDYAPMLEAQREREAEWAAAAADAGPYDPVAAARDHGYGVFTQGPEPDAEGPAWVDPNAETRARMSSAEQRAWDLALYGPGQGEDYLAGLEPYDWTAYGCMGVSDHELGTDTRELFDDSAWSDLREQIHELEQTVDADPRMSATVAAWAECMVDAGHPGYADPSGPWQEMARLSEQVWAEANAGVHLDLSTDEYLTDPAYLGQQAELAERSAELAPAEIALALADATCQVAVDYPRRTAEVWLARQEEFFAAHRAELEAWLAAAQEFEAR